MTEPLRQVAVGTLRLRHDGILHVTFDYQGDVTPEVTDEFLIARNELVRDQARAVVVEMVRFPYASRAVRTQLLDGLIPPICRAVVTPDFTMRAIFKSFQMLARNTIPTATFATVDQALGWIHRAHPDAVT